MDTTKHCGKIQQADIRLGMQVLGTVDCCVGCGTVDFASFKPRHVHEYSLVSNNTGAKAYLCACGDEQPHAEF